MMNLRIKSSIRYKLMFAVGIMFVIFMIVFTCIHYLLLEPYYVSKMKDEMYTFAKEIQTEASAEHLKTLNNETGFKFVIFKTNGDVVISSVPEFNLDMTLSISADTLKYFQGFQEQLYQDSYQFDVLKSPDKSQSQVVMTCRLDSDRYLMISKQLNELNKQIDIANQFFIIVGLSLLIVALIVTYLITKRFVKPVIDISNQAKSIAGLSFDYRYEGPVNDEIGRLGSYMNQISKELKKRIDDLQAANSQLCEDMTLQRKFLASVSHDFKSPVGIIKGFAESLKLNYYKNDAEHQEFAEYIIEEADYLSQLVEDILMLAKMNQTDFTLNKSLANISELLTKSVQVKEGREDVNIKLSIEGDIKGNVDGFRIQQVFYNLIDNAFRYTNSCGEIQMILKQTEDIIKLEVKNSTDAISQDLIPLLTRPFYRLDESRSRQTGGHGLGLSIVEAIIVAHEGHMQLSWQSGYFLVAIDLPLNNHQ